MINFSGQPLANCLFCNIISKKEKAAVVFEDEISFAFLDIRPVFHGHTLLVPKQHHELLSDLPGDLVGPLFKNAQLISEIVRYGMNAQGTFVAMNNKVSQSVPHFHIHIVPRTKGDGLKGFFWPRGKYNNETEIEETLLRLRNAIKTIPG